MLVTDYTAFFFVLNQVIAKLDLTLQQWAADSARFSVVLDQAFSAAASSAGADALKSQLLGPGLKIPFSVLQADQLNGLSAAYTASDPNGSERIYLNAAWLSTASEAELQAVLLEEIGHAIDQRLNAGQDSPGDEGAIFSALIRGVDISTVETIQNDRYTLLIDGQPIAVEAAAPIASGNPTLAPVAEDSSDPAGDSVANLFGPSFTDSDGDSLQAVAITANAADPSTQGDWQYSSDSGNSWTAIPTSGLSDSNALYLSSPTLIRFLPVADFSGTPGGLTTRLIDSSYDPSLSFSASSSNPFNLTDVGSFAAPVFADLDGDGDLDAFIGNLDGNTIYFENTGTSLAPAFAASSSNPFNLINVDFEAAPALADLDGDGDLDAIIGNHFGSTIYFQNTGTSIAPAFAAPSSDPFNLAAVGYTSAPDFADVDDDGDLDAFIGNSDGNTIYFQNTGTSLDPSFAASSSNPFNLTDVGSFATPVFADLDADGDLDAFIGNYEGNTIYFQNTGSSTAPAFTASSSDPFSLEDVGNGAAPVFADLDANGDFDAFIGNSPGNTIYFQNTPSVPVDGDDIDVETNGSDTAISANSLTLSTSITAVSDAPAGSDNTIGIAEDSSYTFTVADFGFSDADGDSISAVIITTLPAAGVLTLDASAVSTNDVITAANINAGDLVFSPAANGNGSGYTSLSFQVQDDGGTTDGGIDTDPSANTISFDVTAVDDAPIASGDPTLAPVAEDSSDPAGDSVANLFGPSFTDSDGDSLQAVAITANAADPSTQGDWQYSSDSGSNWTAIPTSGLSDSTALYLTDSTLIRFLPVADFSGTPGGLTARLIDSSYDPSLSFSAPSSNPFGLTNVDGPHAAPVFADLDGDGDLDAFIGNYYGNTIYFENSGTPSAPDFAAFSSNPFGLDDVGSAASPEFADLDGDGDLDAFIGNSAGNTIYFQNTGTSLDPAFATSSSNPFNLSDVGSWAAPDLADLDGDGDLDAFVGNNDGNTIYFQNTGTSLDPAFAASSSNPFNLTDVDSVASPEFADLDGDGDLDAFIGNIGNIIYFQNTGTSLDPSFAASSSNPFNLTRVGIFATPDLADLDGDGDLDAFIGYYEGNTIYFQNTTPTDGADIDVATNGGDTPFSATVLTLSTSITAVSDAPAGSDNTIGIAEDSPHTFAVADFGFSDADGDSISAVIITTLPAAGALTLDASAVSTNDVITAANINAGDLVFSPAANGNGSGYTSLSFQVQDDGGTTDGGIDTDPSANTISFDVTAVDDAPIASGDPTLAPVAEDSSDPAGDSVANLFGPSFTDSDGDSLQAVAITANAADPSTQGDWQYSSDSGSNWTAIPTSGLSDSTALYLTDSTLIRFLPVADFSGTPGGLTARLIDSSYDPSLSFSASSSNPFGLTNVDGPHAAPVFADLDGDGDLDAFIGNYYGNTIYFENSGTPSAPDFAAFSSNPFGLDDVGSAASPEFADLDGDGDLDAFIGNSAGNTIYFQNTGTSLDPAFATSSSNPFNLSDVGSWAAPDLADLDGDGDLDAFVGNNDGNTIYFQNTGTSLDPAFAASSSNPFNLSDVGSVAAPDFADVDADGDLDAFIGNIGNTIYFQNTGTSLDPAFAASSSNPFNLTHVGGYATPDLADLDGDGDLDAFIGNYEGNTIYFQNTTPTDGADIDVATNGGDTPFSVTALTLSTSITAVNDSLNLLIGGTETTAALSSYSSQDIDSDVVLSDDDNTLTLTGNTWTKADLATDSSPDGYTITENTVLSFSFDSAVEGEIQGIGFDNDDEISKTQTFQLDGTQTWGLQDFDTYSTGSGAQTYTIPVGDFLAGEYQYLTFLNDDDTPNDPLATDSFSNIQLYENSSNSLSLSIGGTETTAALSSYSSQDIDSDAVLSDDDNTLTLTGNTWTKADLATDSSPDGYTITENTVLSFSFDSAVEGEIQGIGFDNDDEISKTQTFQLDGTQTWGLQDFNSYVTGSGAQTYTIPVGDFLAGDFQYLTFLNDADTPNDPLATDSFSNIQLYENSSNSLSLSIGGTETTAALSSYSSQDIDSDAVLSNGDSTLTLSGNTWTKADLATDSSPDGYTITENTVLSFSFDSASEGEIQGIGFDNDDEISKTQTFQLDGTQTWGLQDFNSYVTGSGAQTYTIPVGDFLTGDFQYLTFLNDDDTPNDPLATDSFSNIQLYENSSNSLSLSIGGTETTAALSSYSSQDIDSDAVLSNGDSTLTLSGNTWTKADLATDSSPDGYTITENTVLSFSFDSASEGEIQGIGFDNDDIISPTQTFQLAGSQTWGLQDFDTYSTGSGAQSYTIPVGDFLTGDFQYLTFLNDDDISNAPNPLATGSFSDIQLYDSLF